MNDSATTSRGYVYILEVADIDLPVCKIGMTSRTPVARCAEINQSSTGDFIWAVAHHLFVDDRIRLESLIHEKLAPLRQKRREFFNVCAGDALRAVRSILDGQSAIKELPAELFDQSPQPARDEPGRQRHAKSTFRKRDAGYAELLYAFIALLGIKGRPFGQLSRPIFGMSDDQKGVQWNLAVWTDIEQIQLGVNLEGLAYSGWPIARFIQAELQDTQLDAIKATVSNPELVNIRFVRDAWQVTARPEIAEAYLEGREFTLAEIQTDRWTSMLHGALGCLDQERLYQGRAMQEVTLVKPPMGKPARQVMPISPHLTIWTGISHEGDLARNLEEGIERLRPVHDWVSSASR